MEPRRLAVQHGLTEEEYDRAEAAIGRALTLPEVGVLSAMWSEHCSYKSSRVHLARLPTEGPRVVQGPGENAGAVDIGGGWAAVFKMESHNHPSYIEPYEGAATGVGGILRDVFTMGARPVGLMNSLRFGAIDHPKTPHLFHGVVSGIAGYGNCVGVPTVGGEVYFDASYDGNILVNVFAVGVARTDRIFLAAAKGVGNPVFYVGAGTGRDGIHGATMASEEFGEGSEEKRPTVQVGDPFREKLLIEACLELMETGAIVGIQDMGAAGLTSSAVEMAERGEGGLEIDADAVPKREEGMSAYECLLSESQERMLVVMARGREEEVRRVFAKWELECAAIGRVTDSGRFVVTEGGRAVVDLPVPMLTSGAPRYERPIAPEPRPSAEAPSIAEPDDLGEAIVALIGSPNVCSRRSIYAQFDHMVGLGMAVGPGRAGAAVLRIPWAGRTIAIAVDCNARFCALDAYEGARLAVAECTRNVSCAGATPAGATDCMNFGDPTRPTIMRQFARAVDGMREACLALGAPITGGNVSLYNASHGADIDPTPTVAVVGVFDEADPRTVASAFISSGDELWLLGRTDSADLGGSEYAHYAGQGRVGRPPSLDLDLEVRVQAAIRALIADGLARSAHDLSEGGLGVALAECCAGAERPLGALIELDARGARPDLYLLSESPSRVLFSAAPGDADRVRAVASLHGAPLERVGAVTKAARLVWPAGGLDLATGAAHAAHAGGLERLFEAAPGVAAP